MAKCKDCLHMELCARDERLTEFTPEQEALCQFFVTDNNVGGKWIPVTERLPDQFVSVLGYMTDAGDFPPVRECYVVGKAFYFPALCEVRPVSHWMPMPDMRKGEDDGL